MTEAGWPQTFPGALKALTRWLEAEQVPYVTIGGLAVSLLAQPRATQDIDIVIWLEAERWPALVSAGTRFDLVPRIAGVLEFALQARVLLLQHQPSGISIDVSCGALPFEQEMIARARTLEFDDLQLRVPTPEDLIITKAVAQRAKDINDIEALLNVQANLDTAYIMHWVHEFAAALEQPEMAESIERLLSRRAQGQ